MKIRKKIRHLKYANESNLRIISELQHLSFSTNRKLNVKEIINCGAPRSGSTLLNLIVNNILVYAFSNEHNYVDTNKEYLYKLNNSTSYNVVKVHHYLPLIHKRVKTGKAIGFFTHRDIRDIVVSLMQKGWISNFDEYIEQRILHRTVFTAMAYAKCPNMNVFSYSDLLNNKEVVIKTVSEALSVSISQKEIQRIIEETSLESVNKDITHMETVNIGMSEYNPGTGLHKNHITDGRIGKWTEFLTNEQIDVINTIAADYNKYFNY